MTRSFLLASYYEGHSRRRDLWDRHLEDLQVYQGYREPIIYQYVNPVQVDVAKYLHQGIPNQNRRHQDLLNSQS
jgi:hypothetical protein